MGRQEARCTLRCCRDGGHRRRRGPVRHAGQNPRSSLAEYVRHRTDAHTGPVGNLLLKCLLRTCYARDGLNFSAKYKRRIGAIDYTQ